MFGTIYTNLKELNAECNLNNVIYIIKVWCIQTFFEVVLTIFTIGSMLLYTNFFVSQLLEQQIIIMLCMPVAISAFVSLLYVIIASLAFFDKLINAISFVNTNEGKENKIVNLDKSMKKFFIKAHIIAFFLYPLVTLLSFLYILPKYIITEKHSVATILAVVLSILLGLLWAFFAYYTNGKIDWRKIFKKLKRYDSKDITDYIETKSRNFLLHIAVNAVGFLILVSCFIFVLLNFRKDAPTDPSSIMSSMFYILSFASLITLFTQTNISLYFQKGASKSFLNIKELFK